MKERKSKKIDEIIYQIYDLIKLIYSYLIEKTGNMNI